MSETKTYEGRCHCGKVRYRVTTDLGRVSECNCSHCSKKGFLLTFVLASQLELLSGEDHLTEYWFNRKKIRHVFCSTCGVQPYGRDTMPNGRVAYWINVRCLEGVDPERLTIGKDNGRIL